MSNRELSVHTEHEFLLKMETAGLGEDEAQAVIEGKGNELARKVVAYIQRGGYDPTTSQRRAKEIKEIMGKNMLGIEDVIKHLRVTFSEKQLSQLTEIPFTEAVLQECKDTHILFPGYPLTILEIRDKVARELFYSHGDTWYNNQDFAKKKKLQCRWYLIRKNEVPDSFSKIFSEQKEFLKENEEIPYACEVVFMAISYKLTTGKYLFPSYYVRCQDLSSDGNRVLMGSFDSQGLDVHGWSGARCADNLGLASSWKFQIDS